VPFAALRDRRTGKYLIESHTISLTPSLRVLRACTERLQELQGAPLRTGDPGSIVALGNPTYTCSKCRSVGRKRLPGTEEEVNVIAKMFQTETQVVSLLGDNATARELVRWAAQPSETGLRQAVLHIGSHGQFDKDDHRKNVLHLACDPASGKDHVSLSSADGARGQPVDGFVSSDEDDEPDTTMDFPMSYRICMDSVVLTSRNDSRKIRGADSSDYSHGLTAEFISGSDPKWRAELVVLSACQTSRGKVTTEGVLSMARSFIIAGVPCVVASLWKIGDEATIKLMEVFYEALRRDASVARALRFAMVRRLREDPQIKVADWAPFNVWGDPSLCIPRELQLQGRGARSLHHDPIPRFVVQNQQTLQRRWFDSLGRTPRPDTDYDELYGHRDDKPYDSIFYDPSTITRSKIAQEMNSMYKWSWFKDHDNVLQDALP
jgi:CHAT domain-containing protein